MIRLTWRAGRRAITKLHNCAPRQQGEKKGKKVSQPVLCTRTPLRDITLLAKWDNATVCDKLGATHARVPGDATAGKAMNIHGVHGELGPLEAAATSANRHPGVHTSREREHRRP